MIIDDVLIESFVLRLQKELLMELRLFKGKGDKISADQSAVDEMRKSTKYN